MRYKALYRCDFHATYAFRRKVRIFRNGYYDTVRRFDWRLRYKGGKCVILIECKVWRPSLTADKFVDVHIGVESGLYECRVQPLSTFSSRLIVTKTIEGFFMCRAKRGKKRGRDEPKGWNSAGFMNIDDSGSGTSTEKQFNRTSRVWRRVRSFYFFSCFVSLQKLPPMRGVRG